jgi:hypothetical protein
MILAIGWIQDQPNGFFSFSWQSTIMKGESRIFGWAKACCLEFPREWGTWLSIKTKYWKEVPIETHVACSIYKLVQGVNLLVCSELSAIGKSIIFVFLHEFMYVVIVVNRTYNSRAYMFKNENVDRKV